MCQSSVLLELRAQPGHPGRDGRLVGAAGRARSRNHFGLGPDAQQGLGAFHFYFIRQPNARLFAEKKKASITVLAVQHAACREPSGKRNLQGWRPPRQEGTEHRWTAGTPLPREARSEGRSL